MIFLMAYLCFVPILGNLLPLAEQSGWSGGQYTKSMSESSWPPNVTLIS